MVPSVSAAIFQMVNPTLGVSGRPSFVMPSDDAALIHSPADAVRYTGMSPSTLKACTSGTDMYAPPKVGLSMILCGTYWLETERYAAALTGEQAAATAPDVVRHA